MFSKRIWCAAVVGLLTVGGFGGSAPAQSTNSSLSGFYIGIQGGYGWGDAGWSNISLTDESVSHAPDGILGGGYLGYQHDLNGIVVGVEGSLSYAALDNGAVSLNPVIFYETKIDLIATVTARAGIAFDSLMPFVKAGYAGAEVEARGVQSAAGDAFRVSNWEHGWTVGAGLEYRIGEQITIGAEYGYIDLGKSNHSGTTDQGGAYTISGLDTQIQAVMARVSYRFAY